MHADLVWRINTPQLLKEVCNNPGTSVLGKPLTILGCKLHEVAERAAELNDPALNILMLELTLYDVDGGGCEMPDPGVISEAIKGQQDRLA
jgi:hypothetical protein